MRIMKRIGLCLAVTLPILVSAASEELLFDGVNVFKECSDVYGFQVEIRACVEKQAKDSQPILRRAEEKMTRTLSSQWDEDDKYIIEAKGKLAASNQAFINYRDTQCAFEASLVGGGLHRDTTHQACVAELNNRRAARLRDGESWLPLK